MKWNKVGARGLGAGVACRVKNKKTKVKGSSNNSEKNNHGPDQRGREDERGKKREAVEFSDAPD